MNHTLSEEQRSMLNAFRKKALTCMPYTDEDTPSLIQDGINRGIDELKTNLNAIGSANSAYIYRLMFSLALERTLTNNCCSSLDQRGVLLCAMLNAPHQEKDGEDSGPSLFAHSVYLDNDELKAEAIESSMVSVIQMANHLMETLTDHIALHKSIDIDAQAISEREAAALYLFSQDENGLYISKELLGILAGVMQETIHLFHLYAGAHFPFTQENREKLIEKLYALCIAASTVCFIAAAQYANALSFEQLDQIMCDVLQSRLSSSRLMAAKHSSSERLQHVLNTIRENTHEPAATVHLNDEPLSHRGVIRDKKKLKSDIISDQKETFWGKKRRSRSKLA